MEAQKLHDLKSLLGIDVEDIVEYPVPRPDEDTLDYASNFVNYAHAKSILEHEAVNHILARMNAFDSLNKYDIDTYVKLAESVDSGLKHWANVEGIELPELDDVSREIVIEFTADQYSQANGMAQDPNLGGMDGDAAQSRDNMEVPEDKPASWFQKIAQKLGFKDIDFKDMLYLYLINKYNHGEDAEGEANPMQSMMSNMSEDVTSFLTAINEDAPVDMVGWELNVKRQLMKEHPENWEEVLCSNAWKNFGGVGEETTVVEADDATAEAETTDDGIAGPKMSSTVKSDVNKRIGELNDLIATWEAKKHFYGEVKPAIFNAKDVLTKLLKLGGTGKMRDYKQAQLLFQKVSSPISNLFPPSIVKFLATGNDGNDVGNKADLKPVD